MYIYVTGSERINEDFFEIHVDIFSLPENSRRMAYGKTEKIIHVTLEKLCGNFWSLLSIVVK